jgi:hypothetical protein
MVRFCSFATPETLPQARVLATTLRAHHPDSEIVICVFGGHGQLSAQDDFEVLKPTQLNVEDADEDGYPLAANPDTLPARLLVWAHATGADTAVYLAPQTCVYGSLESAVAPAREGGVALLRRVNRLPEDGKHPDHADLLLAGEVSPAFVATSGQVGQRFARWWAHGIARAGTPARWLGMARSVFSTVAWVEDPGCGVSFWNLHERPLERRDDALLAGTHALRFIDFSGFRPDRPYVLSDVSTRVTPVEDSVLAELCGDYAERVRAAGWRPPESDQLNGYRRLSNGVPTDPLLSALWTEANVAGVGLGDHSSSLATAAFASWLREPAPQGARAGLNRYLYAVYERRADLQSAFPNLDADADGLISWAWEQGREELGLVAELLPQTGDGSVSAADAHLTVNVFGYLRDTLGIAEAARLYVKALEGAGVPITTTAVAPDLPVDLAKGKTITRFGHHPYEELHAPFEPMFNLVCLNGDQLAAFVHAGGGELLGDRITIGSWGWETDVIPPSWQPGFQYVDEIWVYSNFVAHNLSRLSPVPVVVVPQAIEVPDPTGVDVELIGEEEFTFLFMFDYFSTLQRKNPIGLIEAFKRAFTPGEGPRLVLKTINEKFRPEAAAKVRASIGGRPDIQLAERYLEPREIAALVAKADCYVSLHRSEGFGLTLADAMVLGTPVIATGYSGNMDFTTDRNSYLVDWTRTKVGPESEVYPAEGTWAEPDLDHAAEVMRHVWQHPDEAATKATRARVDIERQYAPSVTGRVARARLETLLELRRDGPRRQPSHALNAIETELKLDLTKGVPSRRAATGLIRRAAMRMMLPFTIHERNLDRAVLDALRELRADLDRERARGARVRTKLRHLEERFERARAPRA